MLKAISLFSGCGGMDVGAKNAGFRVLEACEIDKHACNSFRKNHPDTTLIEGDINEHIQDLGNGEKFDLVFGGPPLSGLFGCRENGSERPTFTAGFFVL